MMTNIKSIARPYAKAAFEAAKAAHQLPLWSFALKQLSIASQDKKMQAVLQDPRYMPQHISELFLSVLHAVLNNGVATSHNEMENLIRQESSMSTDPVANKIIPTGFSLKE